MGSASVATDAGGNKIVGSDTRYLPFGEARSGFAGSGLPTDRRFTGQISVAGGLIDMNARALDPLLGRFISADTIVPNPADPQSLNRFAYTRNNPLRYTDPTGHCPHEKQPFGCSPEEWRQGLKAGLDGLTVEVNKIKDELLGVVNTPAIKEPRSKPSGVDLSGWLVNQMKSNASSSYVIDTKGMMDGSLKGTEAGFSKWISLVRTGAIWDFKGDLRDAGYTGDVNLGGVVLNFQAVANIHFGFVGRAIGFSNVILEAGAGAFQIYDNIRDNPKGVGGPNTFFDDPFDNWAIRFGEYLYDIYGNDLDKLTQDSFKKSMDQFIKDNGSPRQPLG